MAKIYNVQQKKKKLHQTKNVAVTTARPIETRPRKDTNSTVK